jgi:hypothetical protein
MHRLRLLGGLAGIGGGALAVLAIVVQQPVPGYVGAGLLVLCELALVGLLAHINRPAAGCAVLSLITGLFPVGLVVRTGDLFVGVGYIAIAILVWVVVAPVVAVILARARELAVAAATGVVVTTLLVLVFSGSGVKSSSPAAIVVGLAYFASWSWVGYAMVRGASRQRASSDHSARQTS